MALTMRHHWRSQVGGTHFEVASHIAHPPKEAVGQEVGVGVVVVQV